MSNLSPLEASPNNIWNYKQNKPSLICKDLDLLFGVPQHCTAKILVARGAAKWFSVRRELIKLKNGWKEQIKLLYEDRKVRGTPEYWYNRGKREALEQCRKEIRILCHSERWQCPDFDSKFLDLLNMSQ